MIGVIMTNSKLNDLPELIGIEDIAKHLNVSKASAKTWLEENKIDIIKIGKMIRVRKDDYKNLLKI